MAETTMESNLRLQMAQGEEPQAIGGGSMPYARLAGEQCAPSRGTTRMG